MNTFFNRFRSKQKEVVIEEPISVEDKPKPNMADIFKKSIKNLAVQQKERPKYVPGKLEQFLCAVDLYGVAINFKLEEKKSAITTSIGGIASLIFIMTAIAYH